MKNIFPSFAWALLLIGVLCYAPAQAQDAGTDQDESATDQVQPDVVLEVDGLSCPFCAFGIEKKLKAIDSIDLVVVHLEAGQVDLTLKEGGTVTEEQIREAVAKAGFSTRSITFNTEKVQPQL